MSNPENVRHNALQLKLRTHTLKATEYVGQIVRTGDLYVVEGNTLWGNPGKVTTHWKPSPEPAPVPLATEQPALSPVFTQAQDAARYAHHRMGRARSASSVLFSRVFTAKSLSRRTRSKVAVWGWIGCSPANPPSATTHCPAISKSMGFTWERPRRISHHPRT